MIQAERIVMETTHERMVPESSGYDTFWEHIYRYRFATGFVQGKRVLDIACGEGYGTAALSQAGARSIVGVDISEDACEHAHKKYGVDARQGSAEAIPLPDHSIDLIVSFETVEHVPSPQKFVAECVRVLAPGGTLIISTPNKEVYAIVNKEVHAVDHNPYHCSEMTEDEFKALLAPHFKGWEMYTQNPRTAAWWSLRAFAARKSQWSNLRENRYLRAARMLLFTPHLRKSAIEKYRIDPIAAILSADRPLASWAHPYALKRQTLRSLEEAEYLVAVAHV